MKTKTKTEGKTSTESIGVTEMQKDENYFVDSFFEEKKNIQLNLTELEAHVVVNALYEAHEWNRDNGFEASAEAIWELRRKIKSQRDALLKEEVN